MKNTTFDTTGYAVHTFMNKLGLRGTVLQAYALLYSFTKGERGMFYGTRRYLAKALLVSERSIYRALKTLFERELIENAVNEELGLSGIRCVDPSAIFDKKEKTPHPVSEEKPIEKKAIEEREEVKIPFWTDEKRNAAYKRIICERLGTITPDEEALVLSQYRERSVNPKSAFQKLGKEGRVLMTEPQYKKLAEILSADQLHTYIERLELMLKRNDETGIRCSKAHYKVIKKWIEEDIKL